MPDREKVIKDLEEYRDREFVKEGITVFDNDPRYRKLIIGNALAMLKEQEKQGKWERHYSRPGVYADLFWWCSVCGEPTRYNDAGILYQYCPHCGAKLEPCKET